MPTFATPSAPLVRAPARNPGTTWQAAPPPAKPQPPVLAAQASGAAPPQPQPRVRLQAPEEAPPPPVPARLALPSPEELGIAAPSLVAAKAPHADIDLNTAFARLRELKAQSFSLDRQPQGGFRARFQLPNQQWIEGEGASETTAIAAALARVETK